jgi:hypothetical protein
LLVDDASKWAEQAYGWGVAFDSDTFIFRFARIFQYLGGLAEIREMSEGQATVLMPHLATSPAKPTFALAPIVRTESTQVSDDGEFVAINEVGLALLPVAGKAGPGDAGFAIAPYTEGTITTKFKLRESTELELTGAIGAVGASCSAFARAARATTSAWTGSRSAAPGSAWCSATRRKAQRSSSAGPSARDCRSRGLRPG